MRACPTRRIWSGCVRVLRSVGLKSPERIGTALIAALLFAVGGLAWMLELRAPLHADTSPLSEIPVQMAGREGIDLPLEQGAEAMLRADHNLLRSYTDQSGGLVWAYVGYYGTTRGGRPEHTPAACYEAHGWSILERRVLSVPGAPGLRVNEYLVEQADMRQLVQFWFRSHRSTGLVGGWDQTIDRLVGRVRDGRADGALVRVSAPVGDDGITATRDRVSTFAAALERELSNHWPVETPIADSR